MRQLKVDEMPGYSGWSRAGERPAEDSTKLVFAPQSAVGECNLRSKRASEIPGPGGAELMILLVDDSMRPPGLVRRLLGTGCTSGQRSPPRASAQCGLRVCRFRVH